MKYTISWKNEKGIHYLEAISTRSCSDIHIPPSLSQTVYFKRHGSIISTMILSNAKLYDSWEAASAIMCFVQMIDVPGKILGIDDKFLFEAKLKGI